jgi:hypothetical protein
MLNVSKSVGFLWASTNTTAASPGMKAAAFPRYAQTLNISKSIGFLRASTNGIAASPRMKAASLPRYRGLIPFSLGPHVARIL